MTISQFKKLCLVSLIGFLTLSALIAVVSLLSGKLDDTQIKVILTTLCISGTSICAMSCSAFIEKRGMPVIGSGGIILVALAAIMVISGIWLEIGKEEYWKVAFTLVAIAVAISHALLLHIPSLKSGFKWIQTALAISVSILALQIIFAVWIEIDDEWYYRLIGVVGVIVVLFTLIVPICLRLSQSVSSEIAELKLYLEQKDIYRDDSGSRYRVTKI